MERILKYRIRQTEESVGSFLKRELNLSTALLKKIKNHPKGLLCNGKRICTNTPLACGDMLQVQLENKEDFSPQIYPTNGNLDIIYEDNDLLVINKPPNLPVHPSKGHGYDSLANIVAYYYKNKGQRFTFRCVTRIDKDTSGIVVIAKNAYSHDILTKEIQTKALFKTYLAVVHGTMERPEGTIQKNIRRVPGQATIRRETCPEGYGEKAVTHYRVLTLSLIHISGASVLCFGLPLTFPLNLPALGRRQLLYFIFRFSRNLCFC